MIIAFRNFFRNRMVNLTATSVRYFMPDVPIYCFSFYKNTEDDYKFAEPLYPWIGQTLVKTKYVGTKSSIQDSIHADLTNGYGNHENGCYFTEGFNHIFNTFQNYDDKVLILAEDHFFTTGKTLKEIQENEFDVCYANADRHILEANASILAIVPTRVKHLFPLPERPHRVETLLMETLTSQISADKLHRLSTRNWIDYMGDGCYTNGSDIIAEEMKKAGIM